MDTSSNANGVSNAEFVAAIFRQVPAGFSPAGCQVFGDPAPEDKELRKRIAWTAEAGVRGLSSSANTYFTGGVFPAARPFRISADRAAAVCALLLDDLGTKASDERLGDFKLSWRIETSPGNYQGGLIFAEPVAVDVATNLNATLIAAGLCDKGATSPATRWARLPVGVNGKAKCRDPETGAPFQCRLVSWSPDTRYTPEQITRGLRLTPATPPKQWSPPAGEGRKTSFPSRPASVLIVERAKRDIATAPQGQRRATLIKHCLRAAENILDGAGAYESVVNAFARAGEKNGVARWEVEDILRWSLRKIEKDRAERREPAPTMSSEEYAAFLREYANDCR